MSVQDKVIADLVAERQKAIDLGADQNDLGHQGNDWIAYTLAYLGRAAEGVYRNEKEKQDYRANMVKAGGLILSAIVAYDRAQERKTAGIQAWLDLNQAATAKPETVESPVTA